MNNIKLVKKLLLRSQYLFPTSRVMRHDWVRKTEYLYATGAHILLTGKFIGKH